MDASQILTYVLFVLGFVVLIKGGGILVDGASSIAKKYKISNIVIGLTIVSFGTSAPELIVNILASLKDSSELAIGNVLGSNIFNIFLIIGFASLFIPLKAYESIDLVIILFGITLVMVSIFYFGKTINRVKGVLLLVLYFAFIWYIFFV